MKSERRTLKRFAPCAFTHYERLSAARGWGSQARRRSAYKRAPPFSKNMKRRAKASKKSSQLERRKRLSKNEFGKIRFFGGCTTTHPPSVRVSECQFYTIRVILTFFFFFFKINLVHDDQHDIMH